MSLTIEGRAINRVIVVDDDESVRPAYGEPIEDMGLEVVYETGPLDDVEKAIEKFRSRADAMICDYHLGIKNFSRIKGDLFVASANGNDFPAILCTTYSDSELTLMRSRRKSIPALLSPSTYNPETIEMGFKSCILEGRGVYVASRKPWRSLVRVDEVEQGDGYFYVVIPGWGDGEKIRIQFTDLPASIHSLIKPGKRLHAHVNIGATSTSAM